MKANITRLAIAAIFLGATAVPALSDAISDRQAKMKEVGKNMGIVGKMAKGETEFNADAALAAFVGMKNATDGFGSLFPEGSETGGETEAAPAIFSDRAGFDKAVADFGEALTTASAAAPADLAQLRTTLGMVGQNCGACHKAYRVKKQ